MIGVCSSTVSVWFTLFRYNSTLLTYANELSSRLASSVVVGNDGPIGGPGKEVEIDECLFVKRKYHVGRVLRGQSWVLGGVVRGSNVHFMEFVPDRTINTMIPILARRIASGSIVHSDRYATYTNLPAKLAEYGVLIEHRTVNHSTNFVDPDTGSHTQSIEGLWSTIKRSIRKRGTNHGSLTGTYLKVNEASYRKMFPDCFNSFLYHISLLNGFDDDDDDEADDLPDIAALG